VFQNPLVVSPCTLSGSQLHIFFNTHYLSNAQHFCLRTAHEAELLITAVRKASCTNGIKMPHRLSTRLEAMGQAELLTQQIKYMDFFVF
jgi:hypothetical protein